MSNEKPVAESRSTSLSFSSAGATPAPRGFAKKRKTVGDDPDELLSKESKKKKGKQTSKAKKAKTGALLSFGNDDT